MNNSFGFRWALLLQVGLGLLVGSAALAEEGKRHIYLLIGQSNMAGRAPIGEKEAEVIPRCDLLNVEGQWEPAKNPLNIHSSIRKGPGMQKLGPGYSFAVEMLKEEGVTLGLVVNAKGGSAIESWKKGTRFYEDAVRRTKEAQADGVLKGILWHQGESNSKNPDGYLEKLTALIENLRKDLDAPDVPFVVGQVNNVPEINDQLAALPKKVKHTGCVSSEGLKAYDRWHFDAESVLELGRRYAAEMKKVQK